MEEHARRRRRRGTIMSREEREADGAGGGHAKEEIWPFWCFTQAPVSSVGEGGGGHSINPERISGKGGEGKW